MDLPLNEKRIKVIKDYPMLTLVILLLGVIGYLFTVIDKKDTAFNEHLKQDLLEKKKEDEELLIYWRDLGRQATMLNKMSLEKDNSK